MQSEDALTPWLTPRCLWTGCVSCPALLCSFLLLPPAGVVICILGADSVSRAHSAKQIFAVGQQEEWNYWPGRFFVPSDPMSVGYLRKRPPMLNFLPPYPTNNKFAKCLAFLSCATYLMQWCSLEGNRRHSRTERREGRREGGTGGRWVSEGRNGLWVAQTHFTQFVFRA